MCCIDQLKWQLAIFSKAATCTLPAVILLIIWWKKDSIKLKDVLWVTPFLLSTLFMARLTIINEQITTGARGLEWNLSFWERFIIAGKSLWFYLYSLIYPLNIAFAYPKWAVDSAVMSHYLPSLAFLALIAGLGLLRKKVGKALLVAILFFAGTLFPSLGFFDIYYMRYSYVTDHFQYLACIGPITLFSSFLTTLTPLATSAKLGRIKPYFLPVFSFSLLLVLGLLTWKQTHIYKNDEVLWRDTLSKNPSSWRAHGNLGRELQNQGKPQEALDHYLKAVALNPNFSEVHFNLGGLYHKKGELILAVSEFKRSLELNPAYYRTYRNLAGVLAEQGKLEEALLYARKCVSMKPDYIQGIITLGNILEALGELNEAQATYRRALELNTNSFENYLNLANVLYRIGNLEEATPHFRKTIALNPGLVEAYNNLGNILGQQGHLEEAQKAFEQAINLDENLPLPYYGLGIIHQLSGQNLKAIEAFKKTLSLNPELEQAHNFLAKIYEKMGQEQKAVFHIRSAEKIAEKNLTRRK